MQRFSSRFSLSILVTAFLLQLVGATSAASHPVRADALFNVNTNSVSDTLPQETGDEVMEANWQQHPKIKTIRAIVQTVKAGMNRKTFTIRKRAFEYCEPGEDTNRTLAVDAKGLARFYESEGGSDDSSLKMEHYYDEAGRLRFVFITGGAVNGSQLEHRIYFDETGKRIWEKQTYKKGPGYTFPTVWPDDQLQLKDAVAKFASSSPCPEKRMSGKGKRTR